MPRSEGQKGKLVWLLRILARYTDEEHLINVPRILELLAAEGIAAERKSVYDDIATLRALGYDIVQHRGRGGGRKDAVVAALSLKPGDFVGLTAGKKLAAQKTAGVLRKVLGNTVEGHMNKECYEFCWIVDFPMYEIGEESGKLEFCHNPFSMPQGGLRDLEEKDPLDIYAYQYDLVCNGVELSSGAVRNHDPEIMVKAFELVGLGEDDVKAKFPAMYNAFCYGAPPHAGIAPGVDRMVMLIAGEESIREIIPFPMNKTAQDVMMGAPAEVDPQQLKDVHIQVVMPEKTEEK